MTEKAVTLLCGAEELAPGHFFSAFDTGAGKLKQYRQRHDDMWLEAFARCDLEALIAARGKL